MRRTHAFLACTSALLIAAQTGAQTALPDPLDAGYPAVLTPTRLVQSLADVPASVTVISAETIERFGIRSIPEALRLVPGMSVVQATGPDYRISYHGTNALSPRRMNVLIDGISVYRPAFSEVIWSQLPVAIEDVERIEVTRGPNSASYGPNSMLAVVNIITKNPNDVPLGSMAGTFGTNGVGEFTVRTGLRLGGTALRVTVSTSRDRGFDTLTQDVAGHDSLRIDRFAVRSHSRLAEHSTLDLQASIARGTAEIPFIDDFQQSYPDRRFEDTYAGALWTTQLAPNHELLLRLDHARQSNRQAWATCLPTVVLLPEMFALWRANPAYADAVLAGRVPTGGTPTDDALALAAIRAIQVLGAGALAPRCVRANQDLVQQRVDLELQDTYVFSGQLRVVAGLGLRHQSGESQTYLGGEQTSSVRWFFGNVEYRPTDRVTLNLGGYAERNSLSPSTFSPRAAANLRLAPGHTLRVVFSNGTRSPDIQEQRTNWSYRFEGVTPPLNGSTTAFFYQSRTGPGNLTNERIRSRELGYLLNAQSMGLLFDVRVFDDQLSSLISERTNLAGLVPTNAGSVRLTGAELQLTLRMPSGWNGYANYAYLDNRDATNILERTQWSRHSGAVGLSRDIADGWQAAIAYAGQSGDGYQQSAYGRAELSLSRAFTDGGTHWRFTFGLNRLDSPVTTYSNGSTEALESRRSNRLGAYVRLGVTVP
ncbi:MAG: TonB-dependent receptor [Piscinibacter sp.]|uniref:TonB-dependent receptor plug domain-containing protein n=1 Tax=Piscinibacter sp. TaxID=1903157 RepID=UPI00258BDA25|nr:TonB-dependent receptor [Piscinibacter sp.]MCW5662896.1 TonB-dependent receptor [Piscinibacter sp.]